VPSPTAVLAVEDLYIDGIIIWKCIFREQDGAEWAGFIRVWIERDGRLFDYAVMNFCLS
jgi:hypothetical protein